MVVEFIDPVAVFCEQACGHDVGHVGEDADADAGALEALRPVDHGRVEFAPEVDVGCDELVDLRWGEGDLGTGGDCVPVGWADEIAAVVGVAVGPVFAMEEVFAKAGDGAHACPCGGVG